MNELMSYNQMLLLYGKDDEQVRQIREHLDCINPNKVLSAESHNASLEAFKRKPPKRKPDCSGLFNLCYSKTFSVG